ncbi:hypothetical protein ACFXJ8_11640, partial [Nonomuraea sp. NPDC059194]
EGQEGQPPADQEGEDDQPPAAREGQEGQPPADQEGEDDQPPAAREGQEGQPPAEQEGLADGGQMRDGGGPGSEVGAELTTYLEEHQEGATWLVAVGSAGQAASLILQTGKPVIAMGGFTGADPAMTVDRLRELVASGQLRHVLTGGGRDRGGAEVTAWVQENCAPVDGHEGLYRCAP